MFQLHAEDAAGHVLWRKRLRREELEAFLANQPPSVIGMEACCEAVQRPNMRSPHLLLA